MPKSFKKFRTILGLAYSILKSIKKKEYAHTVIHSCTGMNSHLSSSIRTASTFMQNLYQNHPKIPMSVAVLALFTV
jgi:hypothetical protein